MGAVAIDESGDDPAQSGHDDGGAGNLGLVPVVRSPGAAARPSLKTGEEPTAPGMTPGLSCFQDRRMRWKD